MLPCVFAEANTSVAQDKIEGISAPSVTAVYPSSNTVPENLLRMYVVFDQPMKTVDNLSKIRLLDDQDQTVEGAIFNHVHELWDAEQKQLTLIFEPARVKTGLEANQRFGRALLPGKTYRLMISGLENIHHQKMETPFVKTLHVTHADQEAPNKEEWALNVPVAQSRDALNIKFFQVIDRFSLMQRLIVTDSEKNIIKGKIQISKDETEWSFKPAQEWASGRYWLYINRRLEDPAGNNLNGLFDHKPGSLKHSSEDTVEKIALTITNQR